MHRTVVMTKEIEKITALPPDLKKFSSLELLIYPPPSYKKEELKRKMAKVFKKARETKITVDVNIDELMNEMNDALP